MLGDKMVGGKTLGGKMVGGKTLGGKMLPTQLNGSLELVC